MIKSETKLLATMGVIVALAASFLTCNRPSMEQPPPVTTPAPLDERRFAELEKSVRHWQGPAAARFTVIEFADFECPSCRAASALAVGKMGKEFPQIRFGFKHFPLERLHQNALPAAVLTELAAKQGKFWDVYEALMKDAAESLTPERVEQAAKAVGIDSKALREAQSDSKLVALATGDRDGGMAIGVSETPTFFVHDTQTHKLSVVTGYRQLQPLLKDVPGLPTPPPQENH